MDYEYIFAGTLPVNTFTYVKRSADQELYENLKAGKFCYVLNPRQTGKSSLRIQTMIELQKEGIVCVAIDLSIFDTYSHNPERWYADLIDTLADNFNIDFDLDCWWESQELISPLRKLSKFIEDILLIKVKQNIVIFIDEIDSILSLKFPCDDFFALIRGCYNLRVDNPHYNRLTFCLLGVATPRDLIADRQRTPFNIGQAIELTPFSLEDLLSSSLIKGLEAKVKQPKLVLEQVWYWTGGQPFLTQKLCDLLVKDAAANIDGNGNYQEWIAQTVQNRIISNWEYQDNPEHLRTIRDRLLRDEEIVSELLAIYQQISQGGKIHQDNSSAQMQLCLSGLVIKQNGKLRTYNRIYQAIFSLIWVEKQLASLRPYATCFNEWLASSYQDKSSLLRGKALEDAQNWSQGKHLSALDYQFLAASQEYDHQEVIEAQKRANFLLQQSAKKANQLIHFGSLILGCSFVGAFIAFFLAFSAVQKQQLAQKLTQLEQQGNIALRKFEFDQIGALLSAMETGEELKKMLKDDSSLGTSPTNSPILALGYMLNKIAEKNQLSHPEMESGVNSSNFSPNGEYIVTASDDTAQVWAKSSKKLVTLHHQDVVYRATFSPNNQYIVTASKDTTAKVWDISGKELVTLPHQGTVHRASFSGDGKYIVTVAFDGEFNDQSNYNIAIWDWKNNRKVTSFQLQKQKVIEAIFTANGLVIATTSNDGKVSLWDQQGEPIKELVGHQKEVKSIALSQDNQFMATASSDATIRLWNQQGELIQLLEGHSSWVNSVTFSSDNKLIASASRDGSIIIWNRSGGQKQVLRGHRKWVYGVAFSLDNQYIVSASADQTARIWDLSSEYSKILKRGESWVFSVEFSPDGKLIATGSGDAKLHLWHKNGQLVKSWQVADSPVYSIAFNHKNQLIATGSHDIESGSREGKVHLWNYQGDLVKVLRGHQDSVYTVAFSPDGKLIASGSRDGKVRLWNLQDEQVKVLDANKWVNSVTFSPDGKLIATGSRDNIVRLWDRQGNLIKNLIGHRDWVYSVTFSPDGKLIATGSRDRTARLWDRQGDLIKEMEGYQESINDLSFHPNGQLIAMAYYDGTVRLWDIDNELMFQELKGHGDWVNALSISPDGQLIATASRDGTARLWSVDSLDQLLERGCDWLQDYFVNHPEDLETLQVCQQRFSQ